MNLYRDNSPELRVYWDALAEGRLLLPHCRSCGRAHWYPRGFCPHCCSTELEQREATGQGVVLSFTHAPAATSAVAYVTLEEGPTLLTRILDVDPSRLSIGQRVTFVVHTEPADVPVPLFKPA